MSDWTYVNGTMLVEIPFYSVKKDRVKDYIEWSINQVKKYGYDITGSEGPAEIYINMPAHPCMYSSETSDSWDNANIQIVGSLRDRMLGQTRNEVKAFLKKLSLYMSLDNINITVNGYDEEVITETAYSHLYDYNDNEHYDEYEKLRDKLYEIQMANKHRYFDSLLNIKIGSEFAEIITNSSPSTIEGFLNNFGIDRIIDWDFTERIIEWYKEHKVKLPNPDEEKYVGWFKKRKYPPKPDNEKLIDELRSKAYGRNSYDYDPVEQEKNRRIYRIVDTAVNDKKLMEKVNRWG